MVEEKKPIVVDSVYDLDPKDSFIEDYLRDEVAASKRLLEERRAAAAAAVNARSPRRSPLLMASIVAAAGFALSVLAFLHLRKSDNSRDEDSLVKFRTSFRGYNGHLIEQEVVSSDINNIVEYYIDASPNERLTIIDDFNKDIQVVKISKKSEDFCYVSQLKKGSYVRPSDLLFGTQADKQYVSRVFETYESEEDPAMGLGDRGAELCRDIPVQWIRPVDDTESYISAANFTESSQSSNSGSRSRSKRNIRNCHMSCCYQVCCCTVHHFTWERVEHFTCNHICDSCTSAYKKVVRKLC